MSRFLAVIFFKDSGAHAFADNELDAAVACRENLIEMMQALSLNHLDGTCGIGVGISTYIMPSTATDWRIERNEVFFTVAGDVAPEMPAVRLSRIACKI